AEDRQSDSAPQCHLVGNTGNSTLSLPPENIIYVESMSNYADICYMEDDEVRHKMLRITLKQIKECIADNKFMVQCHRAFIVNLNFVVTITNRNSGYLLQIFGTDKQIPVSRTYTAAVKESLQVSAK
ncbi:MAG: LytR/AlgR family response regulator transcription factor, partial [Prevotella sp.]